MPAARTRIAVIFILPFIAALCFGVLLGVNLLFSLPERAEERFGPPAPQLSAAQRIRLSALLLWQADDLLNPTRPTAGDQNFEVLLGESTPSVIDRLWRADLVSNPAAFRTYLQYAGLDKTLQAGDYVLNAAMTPVEIGLALQDSTPAQIVFTVLPGWRTEEIAAALPTSGLAISPEDFIARVMSRPRGMTTLNDLPQEIPLEGFLFPDTYEIDRTITVDEFVMTLVSNFDRKVTPEIRAGFGRQGLNLFQAVVMASIVEREAVVDEEQPLIASVFINRWKIGMKLDADPTVQYALGYNEEQETWWTNPLSAEALAIASPYNTYQNAGLPPGPIANPSLGALRGVAFPAQTPYYYFRAACDDSGRHIFAENFEDHKANACP